MPARIRGSFDARSVAQAFAGAADGLNRAIGDPVADAPEPIAKAAGRYMIRGEGPNPRAKAGGDDRLPHIADTITAQRSGLTAAIVSSHPAAPVFEYGGTIAPRGEPIEIRRIAPA